MGESHFMVGLNSFWSAGASCSGLQAQVDERSSRRRCQLWKPVAEFRMDVRVTPKQWVLKHCLEEVSAPVMWAR